MMDSTQQFCLRWNNHQKNIASVFERLRESDLFTDVTLVTADQKSLKCHKLVLCAGSGFLEDILSKNPSEHPTIVLSQILNSELQPLVEFMYNGEVAIEQSRLQILLEAANILKIKGLWESGTNKETSKSSTDEDALVAQDKKDSTSNRSTSIDSLLSSMSTTSSIGVKSPATKIGSQKRKRKMGVQENGNKYDEETKMPKLASPSPNPIGSIYSPLFGVSNAYFLTDDVTKPKPASKKSQVTVEAKLSKENSDIQPPMNGVQETNAGSPPTLPIPAFLAQLTSLSPPGLISPDTPNSADQKSISPGLLSSAPVRRYKKYTEDMLQDALRDIISGKSINSSSNKFNIPARTLRDWMKRLNIKSVFTHHSQKDSRSASVTSEVSETSDASMDSKLEIKTESDDAHEDGSGTDLNKENQINRSAFPGMPNPDQLLENLQNKLAANGAISLTKTTSIANDEEEIDDVEEDEEEIDDDEEESLKIVE
ncbi:hypothetical protein TCAL_10490 [Tigriopus californicus]|uniref:Uncharacterized protein n=1 Tax=Tigriopus californicus TaxID=6832 RepID=A0A553PTE4_TIGCA|nr:protein bric-a-brac 2-like [Tigriopus californicus]XP_059096962.1 protein bric-a-brac 2-like [Tigriopus californicus]TRY80934.1 hypothetical protein TCAL_10490 [Tigriopus californicus]|eukprot:TCALIF_10490-PA protein Name:"Similar to ttk Protein tramtrack, beta isoform (Drosophila melanogaster)" AED:0.00 eAED:0.00 QI:230/1/0.8/1/1/0.8/5/0/482